MKGAFFKVVCLVCALGMLHEAGGVRLCYFFYWSFRSSISELQKSLCENVLVETHTSTLFKESMWKFPLSKSFVSPHLTWPNLAGSYDERFLELILLNGVILGASSTADRLQPSLLKVPPTWSLVSIVPVLSRTILGICEHVGGLLKAWPSQGELNLQIFFAEFHEFLKFWSQKNSLKFHIQTKYPGKNKLQRPLIAFNLIPPANPRKNLLAADSDSMTLPLEGPVFLGGCRVLGWPFGFSHFW